jgi:uncharacterized damage-inducible protein DinB
LDNSNPARRVDAAWRDSPIYHRGQPALLPRMLGREPGNFDLLFYDAELEHKAS